MSDYSDSEANYPTISYSNGVGVLYQNHIRLLPQSYRMGMESVYGKIFLYRRMGICSLLLLMRAGLGTVVMLFSCDLGIMDSSDRNSSLQSRGKAVDIQLHQNLQQQKPCAPGCSCYSIIIILLSSFVFFFSLDTIWKLLF